MSQSFLAALGALLSDSVMDGCVELSAKTNGATIRTDETASAFTHARIDRFFIVSPSIEKRAFDITPIECSIRASHGWAINRGMVGFSSLWRARLGDPCRSFREKSATVPL